MDKFIFVLEYEDSHGKSVTSISTFSEDSVSVNIEGNFLVILIKDGIGSSRNNIVQKIILPYHKVHKAELLDFTSSKCPAEYVELALMQIGKEKNNEF